MTEGKDTPWVRPETLRALRERAGLTYDEVERRARKLARSHYTMVTKRDLENWERGLGEPGLEHLETLSEIFDCPVGYFFMPAPPAPSFPRGRASPMKKKERLAFMLAVRLPIRVAEELRAVSRSRGLSVSSIVRELILVFLEGRAPHFNGEAKDAGKNRDT